MRKINFIRIIKYVIAVLLFVSIIAILNYFDILKNYTSEVIASSALLLAIWQGISIRKHNRISVRPHLSYIRRTGDMRPQVSIVLSNSGIGPAFIKRMEIYIDNKKTDLSNMMELAKLLKINAYRAGGTFFFSGDAIQASKEFSLFEITTHPEKDIGFNSQEVNRELDRLKILIKYESGYGEKFELTVN